MSGEFPSMTAADLHNDAHFLRAVSQMAESQRVIARQAIYAQGGVKLLEQGGQIDGRLYERLMQHRLVQGLDEQLVAQNPVDVHALQAQVRHYVHSTALGRLLAEFMGHKQQRWQEALAQMAWPDAVCFQLTVLRQQLPQLFEHSLGVMMVAVALAVEEGLSRDDCAELAAAALLHDIGMLYMPRHWTDPRYKLTPQEYKQLAAHSVIAMLLVRSTQAYTSRVEDAVLQHHERLDGSGYPSAIKGGDITQWGRILMLAEVVAAFYDKYSDIPAQRLSLMLRMNHQRFDARLMQHVFRILQLETQAQASSASHSQTEVRQVIATLGAVFQHWSKCKHALPRDWQVQEGGRIGVFVDARLQALEKSLAESGSHPRQQADWLAIFQEDPSSMAEVVMINKEALWQVAYCVETCIRRWPQVMQPTTEVEQRLHDWLVSCRGVLEEASVAAGERMPLERGTPAA